MPKLFISHAANDKPLVTAFVDLLELGVGVAHKGIFCSSLKGRSILPGKRFVDSIHKELDGADCVLALISEAYYASAFCMCELGGTWLHQKDFLPVLVPPVKYADMRAVLSGLHASKIAKAEDLDELRDQLRQRLGLEERATSHWNSKRDEFLRRLPDLLLQIKFRGDVPRARHRKVRKELKDAMAQCRLLSKENQRLRSMVDDLKKTKDAKQVAGVIRKHSTVEQAFKQLVAAARDALKPLETATEEALYHSHIGRPYRPNGDQEWRDVEAAQERGQVETGPEDNMLVPNRDDAKVRKASKALDDLEDWIESQPTPEFDEWYAGEYEDERPDLKLRQFWERHLQ